MPLHEKSSNGVYKSDLHMRKDDDASLFREDTQALFAFHSKESSCPTFIFITDVISNLHTDTVILPIRYFIPQENVKYSELHIRR